MVGSPNLGTDFSVKVTVVQLSREPQEGQISVAGPNLLWRCHWPGWPGMAALLCEVWRPAVS